MICLHVLIPLSFGRLCVLVKSEEGRLALSGFCGHIRFLKESNCALDIASRAIASSPNLHSFSRLACKLASPRRKDT